MATLTKKQLENMSSKQKEKLLNQMKEYRWEGCRNIPYVSDSSKREKIKSTFAVVRDYICYK